MTCSAGLQTGFARKFRRGQPPGRSGRSFAAILGLVQRQNLSGGENLLGPISKVTNGYSRRLLVVGSTTVNRPAKTSDN